MYAPSLIFESLLYFPRYAPDRLYYEKMVMGIMSIHKIGFSF